MEQSHEIKDARVLTGAQKAQSRVFALLTLSLFVGGGGWMLASVIGLLSDSWIAPINLSPDNDRVIQMRLQVTRQAADVERASGELQRIDEELTSINASIERLEELQSNTREIFEWGAQAQEQEAGSWSQAVRNLQSQRRLLIRLRDRQRQQTARSRQRLTAGLLSSEDAERAEQSLDSLELRVIENDNRLRDARARQRVARSQESSFRENINGANAHVSTAGQNARTPEVISRREQETRIELEIIGLQAQRRSLQAMQRIGQRNIDNLREVLDQIRARPFYQASQTSLDVAFVPYDQLDGVRAGDQVLHCEWGIIGCADAGTVAEILPGEVVTQDPWGELARGRYAVLNLHDDEAVMERILRVHQR